MAETERPADNRFSLRHDFLGASAEFESAEREDFALSNSDRHLLHAAAVAENGGSGFILPSAQQTSEVNPNSEAGKRKREERHQTRLTLAEQARLLSEQLARQIAEMEFAFEAQHGDAWREHIANKVMDPDEIPVRRDGESMAEYRKRLEEALIAEMIDPTTGSLKPKYASSDDPDIRLYGDWALARHRENEIAKTPPQEIQAFLIKNADWADVQIAEQSLHLRGAGSEQAHEKSASLRDQASDSSTEASAFGTPPST